MLGAIGNVWGLRAALAAGAVAIVPALGLYGRAIVCNWNGPVWALPNVLVVRTLFLLRAPTAPLVRI